MKILAIATVASFFLVQGANAQCVAQDDALDVCMEAANLGDAGKTACDVCVKAASTAASTVGVTCEELRNAVDSVLCNTLAACPTCPGGCSREVYAYALCEINEEQGTDCSELTCELGAEPSATMEATTGGGGANPTTDAAATTTEGTGETEECATEDTALDGCLTAAGKGDTEKDACDTCIELASKAAATAGVTCETLSGEGNALCTALRDCPTCPSECDTEVFDYALCEVNAEQNTECTDLTCLLGPGETDTSTQAPPTASPTSSASLKNTATSIVGGLGVLFALV